MDRLGAGDDVISVQFIVVSDVRATYGDGRLPGPVGVTASGTDTAGSDR